MAVSEGFVLSVGLGAGARTPLPCGRQGPLAAARRGRHAEALRMRGGQDTAATILLVRHGQTEWNVQGRYQGQKDSPLTTLGRQEAKALGARLRGSGRKIEGVWSSDLARASDTALEIVSALASGPDGVKHELRLDARLRERSFGILEGMTREECRRKHPEEMQKFSSDGGYAISGGGESRSTLVERTAAALVDIAKDSPGKTNVVVTHGAVVSTFIRYLLGIPFSVNPDQQPPGDLQIRNTCICELKYLADGRWLVLSIGDTAHTEELRQKASASTTELTREARSIEQA
eukprot:Tamp_24712.p1 GENE.Tamp_24712~~Tamp_24712.p1  ORF type:complete len:307 (+),score=36.44 Tamp_24712:54-923(+)